MPASRATGFWLVAAAFVVTMLGTTMPTPLYVLYQQRLGFSTLTTTIIFASYAGGVLAALIVLGRVSDTIGRRATLLVGLGCSVASALVFIAADDLALLITGRVLSGLSAGLFTGTATATLVDLAGSERADRATLVATVANMGGLGIGPTFAALFARGAAEPLLLPFQAHLALLLLVAVGVGAMPEPVATRVRFRIVRASVPAGMRRTFVSSAIAGFAGFAVLGLSTAVAPSFLREMLGLRDPVFAGVAVALIFGASLVGQVALVPRLGRVASIVGCATLATGMFLLSAGLAVGSVPVLVVAVVLAGAGQGVSFRAALAALNREAPAGQRAEVASMFFIVAYVAISLPVVGVGLAADLLDLQTAGVAFSVLVGLLAVAGTLALRRRAP